MKKILLVFSHPDDESFGPGGTIALWAERGYNIHLLCATKGENGNNHTTRKTAQVRMRELHSAARILGIQKVSFLNFTDGHICNHHIPQLAQDIASYVRIFQPNIMMTFNLNGVSGHLDHIAVANAATMVFDKTPHIEKLYYHTLPRTFTEKVGEYFIHFPDGFAHDAFDEIIDTKPVWDRKVSAMKKHQSQKKDIERILSIYGSNPDTREYFMVRGNM